MVSSLGSLGRVSSDVTCSRRCCNTSGGSSLFWSGSLPPDALGCTDYVHDVNACRICDCGGLPCVHLGLSGQDTRHPMTVNADGCCGGGNRCPDSKYDCSQLIHFFAHLFLFSRSAPGLQLVDVLRIGNLPIILPIYYHNNNMLSNVLIDSKIEIWYSLFALKSSDFSIFRNH